jgi:hypothetical protein
LKAGKNTHISSLLQEEIQKYRYFFQKTASCLRQERHLFVFLNLRPNYNRAFGAIFGPFQQVNPVKTAGLALIAIPVSSLFFEMHSPTRYAVNSFYRSLRLENILIYQINSILSIAH